MSIVSKLLVTGAQLMRKQQNIWISLSFTLCSFAMQMMHWDVNHDFLTQGKLIFSLPLSKSNPGKKDYIHCQKTAWVLPKRGGGGEQKKLSRCPTPGATCTLLEEVFSNAYNTLWLGRAVHLIRPMSSDNHPLLLGEVNAIIKSITNFFYSRSSEVEEHKKLAHRYRFFPQYIVLYIIDIPCRLR